MINDKDKDKIKFGWIYDIKTIYINTHYLFISKYLFYISSKGDLIHLIFSSSYQINQSCNSILFIDKTSLDNDVNYIYNTSKSMEEKTRNLFINEKMMKLFKNYMKNNKIKDFLIYPNNIDDIEDRNKKVPLFSFKNINTIKVCKFNVEDKLLDMNNLFNLKLINESEELFREFKSENSNNLILGENLDNSTSSYLIKSFNNSHTKLLLKFFQEIKNTPTQNNQDLEIYRNLTNRNLSYYNSILSKLNHKYTHQINWNKDIFKTSTEKNNQSNNNPKNSNEFKKDISIFNSNSYYLLANILTKEDWIELSNNSKYSGFVKNSFPHGYGKEYRNDGLIYEGKFMNGKWHGIGILTDDNLDSTVAEYIDGKVSGI